MQDNRGLKFLVGLAVVVLLIHMLINGRLFQLIHIFQAWLSPKKEGVEGFESVTGLLLPILIEAIMFIGGVTLFGLTAIGRVCGDLLAGIYETVKGLASKNTSTGSQVAPVVASPTRTAAPINSEKLTIFLTDLNDKVTSVLNLTADVKPVLNSLSDRVAAIEEHIFPKPLTPEQENAALKAQLAELQQKLAAQGMTT